MTIGAVIAAAGMSARLKDFKQLMKIGDLTMAERVIMNFRRAGVKEIVMVTGHQAKKLEKELHHLGITFLRNEEYETTQMFDSAKIGLAYLKDRCDRILFCPVDVPFFSDRTVDKILEQEGELVIPVCKDETGHPIRIDSSLLPGIFEYQGDNGLRGALDSLDVEPVKVYVEDEGAITDADTEADYEYLVEIHNARLMRPQIEVCLAGKKSFFGSGTVTLLKHIARLGSVREACQKTCISYSKGWEMIHMAERELEYKVVDCRSGGKNGGRAVLSEKGKRLLELFEDYEGQVKAAADRLYKEIFLDSGLL